LCAGPATAARIDHGEKHRSPTRNTPQPRAFRGTDAKEVPILRETDDRVVFDTSTGRLYYDADGSATGAGPLLIATVQSGATVAAADIVVI
jgi:hypothetical protein